MEPQGDLVKSIYLGLVMNAGFCFLGHQYKLSGAS